MAFSGWHIIRKEATAGAFTSQAPRQTGIRQLVTWDALAIDDGSPPMLVPGDKDVTETLLLDDPIFPITNESIFEWSTANAEVEPTVADTVAIPWLRCLGKRAERDQQNRLLFHVTADYGLPGAYDIQESELYP
jgi:hypothetical protein